MADQGPTRDELWARALKHAGIAEGEVARVDVDRLDAKSQGRFMPPGERDVGVDQEALGRINAVAEQPRVVLATMPVAGDAPAALGLMRNHLEYARVFTKEPATYALTVDVAAALYQVYRDAGPGSAVVYNAIPMMSSANAVAAELVTLVFGPQVGRFRDPRFGVLFRTERDPTPRRISRGKRRSSRLSGRKPRPRASEGTLRSHGA